MLCRLENISLEVNQNQILRNISITINKGEIITLIGPNGGGKTSIARILLGILSASSGKIIKDPDLKIGYMPQKISFDSTIPLTSRDFITLSKQNVTIDEDLVKTLNVANILDKQIQDLSGGQLQKILLIKALSHNPDLLVLDEPTQYLDIGAIEDFYSIIDDIKKTRNCSILLISHDLLTIMKKTDSVFCINNHICCSGEPEKVNQHPEYISLFGNKSNFGIYQHHHNHKH